MKLIIYKLNLLRKLNYFYIQAKIIRMRVRLLCNINLLYVNVFMILTIIECCRKYAYTKTRYLVETAGL